MERTGKVIIFDNTNDAETWFYIIDKVKRESNVRSLYADFLKVKEQIGKDEDE